MEKMLHPLSLFVFWYPLVMSLVWIAGSLIFHKRREKIVDFDIDAIDWPMVSLLIPCFNEEESLPLFYNETKKVLNKMHQILKS